MNNQSDNSIGGNQAREPGQTKRQVWYLPNSTILEEVRSKKLILMAIGTICFIIFALVVWASFTKIQEVAVAKGEIEPIGRIRVVQHLEGGTIQSISVKNGDLVKKGQLLVKLVPTEAIAELKKAESRRLVLTVDKKRITAFLDNKGDLDLMAGLQGQNLSPKKLQALQQMIKDDKLLFKVQKLSRSDKRSVVLAQIEQRKRDLDKFQKQKQLVEKNLALFQKEERMFGRLRASKYVSERDHLKAQRSVIQAKRDLIQLKEQINQAKKGVDEAQNKLNELNSGLRKTSAELLGEINSELLQLNYQIEKLKDRVKRTDVLSPVSGYIKGLELTVGSVVPAGGVLLNVVPTDVRLQALVRISTMDIGHVKVGDPVRVKISNYDFTRYGLVMGKLETISATTFVTDKGEAYYRGIVSLSQQYVGSKKHQLIPGMIVEANIVTGKKTVMKYLIKPIDVTVRSGLRER